MLCLPNFSWQPVFLLLCVHVVLYPPPSCRFVLSSLMEAGSLYKQGEICRTCAFISSWHDRYRLANITEAQNLLALRHRTHSIILQLLIRHTSTSKCLNNLKTFQESDLLWWNYGYSIRPRLPCQLYMREDSATRGSRKY